MQSMMLETGGAERTLGPCWWYAVYAKHQHEKRASELLARKGFEVFLPLYRTEHRWKDRTRVVSLPLFPSYLFLRTDLVRKIEILRTPGVFWLIENGGHACPVPETDIEAVRRITQSSANIQPHPYLRCGDFVRVREGALAGIEGILTRVKNRYRVILSVDLLQKAIAVEVDLSVVERVNRSRGNSPPAPEEVRRIA